MITDLKDFEKMLKICRKQGIDHLKVGEIEVKFGALPNGSRSTDSDDTPTDEPTPEQMLFYAVNGGR